MRQSSGRSACDVGTDDAAPSARLPALPTKGFSRGLVCRRRSRPLYRRREARVGPARGFMSWNNQGGGPWRSGQGPWGAGPGGGQSPGDLEEALRRLQNALRGLLPSGGGSAGRGIVFLVLVAILLWFAWGFYTVQPNEIGINLVFGRNAGKTVSGLNYNWPWPVGFVIKVPVSDQKITEVGYRTELDSGGGTGRSRSQAPEESLMLTSDQNIVDVQFRVIWQIDPARPEDFVFDIRHPEETVKAVAESVMREVVGLKTIDGILTSDRKSIEPDVQKRMQSILDGYKAGVLVLQVQLQLVDAPAEVLSAYRDVTAAQQDLQAAVNEADKYANKVVPEAEGEASRIRLAAQGYRQKTVAEAIGQTSRFDQVYAQYKNAPGVTRERLYLETMEHVLGAMDKTILDTTGVSPPVPYLALDALRPKPAGAAK
jgi:membrane protease subunit HflK